MSENQVQLTAHEIELARQSAIKTVRKRMELLKPDVNQYVTQESRAVTLITNILSWSKAFVPIIALLAALASAVRTVQTASEIYSASGSNVVGVIIAAIAFTLAAEGALFTLALAQEGQRMKWRAEKKSRRVWSLLALWEAISVRGGWKKPLRYDELPEGDGLSTVIAIAFMFTVASNMYLGLRPLLTQIGMSSLQTFIQGLVNANANLQMTFLVDLASVLFPPLMALQAGHLTARFAAEMAEGSQAVKLAYQRDLERWNADYTDPLETDAGREALETYLNEKLAVKRSRILAKGQPESVDQMAFLARMQTPRKVGDQ